MLKKYHCLINIVALFIIIGCNCKDKYEHYDPDKALIFQKGDTLIYESNLNQKDTFLVSGRGENEFQLRNEDFCNTKTYRTELSVKFCPLHLNCYGSASYEIGYLKPGQMSGHWKLFTFNIFPTYVEAIGNFEVNNIDYKNVFLAKGDYSTGESGELYCNERYGVLQWKFEDGITWKLIYKSRK